MTGLFLVLAACGEKDDTGEKWRTCSDCTLDSWVGSFSGKATYFDAVLVNEVPDLDATVVFQKTGDIYLTAYVTIPEYFSATMSGGWTSPYSISFAGSGTSVSGTMYTRYDRDSEFRFSGNSKKFHYKGNELVVDEVVTFEVYK
jgi:hypothetical protein